MLVQQRGDTADLALYRFAARLSGVRGEHGVEFQATQQLGRAFGAHLVQQVAVRHHQLVRCVHGRLHRHVALQLAQRFHTVVLLGQVRQMEERRERAHHHLRLVDRQRVDELDGLAERPRALGVGRGDALGIGGLVCGDGARVALVRPDHAVEQTVEESADGRIVLLEHLSLHAEEQHEVVAQALGDLDLRVGLDSLGGVRRA